MNYIVRNNQSVPGEGQNVTCRFLRLNYFWVGRSSLGATVMSRPNILLVNIDGQWRKLHEGESIDFGEVRTFRLQVDWFPNHFTGQLDTPPDYEIEVSNFPLADLRVPGSNNFLSGKTVTLANTDVLVISDPPNVVYPTKYGINVRAPLRRFVLNNVSGGEVLLSNQAAVTTQIPNNTRYAENLRGQVMIGNLSGANRTFYYEFHFEWV
ncbi:MAG: hypothetical protein U1F65_05735 [Verrucomicrobiota bacterium]